MGRYSLTASSEAFRADPVQLVAEIAEGVGGALNGRDGDADQTTKDHRTHAQAGYRSESGEDNLRSPPREVI